MRTAVNQCLHRRESDACVGSGDDADLHERPTGRKGQDKGVLTQCCWRGGADGEESRERRGGPKGMLTCPLRQHALFGL